jgi:hypothetical protein
LDEQAAGYAGSTSVNQGSDPAGVQAALDNAYRSALTAWVQSADANGQAAHREAEKRINAYLAAPPKQRKLIELFMLELSTLPLLPAELIALDVSHNKLTALPANLPQGLQELYVRENNLIALPANLPQSLKRLVANNTGLSPETLLALMRTNTSITDLVVDEYGFTTESWHELANEITNNQNHPARVAKAAATLDLLTRLGTTSDQTGDLIRRDPIPDPVAGQLPQQSIPAELHQVLAEHCPKGVLAVLGGMVDRADQ